MYVTELDVAGLQGLLTEGFFWIPSLAGPTTIAARTSGSGISWLFPFVVSCSLEIALFLSFILEQIAV